MTVLSFIEIESNPGTTAAASIIWLHGLGASGEDFIPLVPELRLPESLAVRFVFPHAPVRAVTINNGYLMPAWYDILEMDLERKVDEEQLIASADAIKALIEREIVRGVDSKKIILAGFSQGGAVVYHAGLTYEKPLAGLLILSSYLATNDSSVIHAANQHTPILIQHGTDDSIVNAVLGQRAFRLLSERGCMVNYQSYPMDHTLCTDQVAAISQWIQQRLN